MSVSVSVFDCVTNCGRVLYNHREYRGVNGKGACTIGCSSLSSLQSCVQFAVQLEDDTIAFVVRVEWNEPENDIVAKDALEVLEEASVIRHLRVEGVVLLVSLLTELDGRILATH